MGHYWYKGRRLKIRAIAYVLRFGLSIDIIVLMDNNLMKLCIRTIMLIERNMFDEYVLPAGHQQKKSWFKFYL